MGIRSWWRSNREFLWPRYGERDISPLSFQDWVSQMAWNLAPYQTLRGNEERVAGGFTGLVEGAYKRNGVIFACMLVRQLLFSEARFQFQQLRGGRPGDLFGNQELALLENPWPKATTGDLLTRMIQDADLAGNAFILRQGDRLTRLRPDWVTIVSGSERTDATMWDLDSELLGSIYHPGGRHSGSDPIWLDVKAYRVAHFAPVPDPEAPYRGMSWLGPVLREISADSAATSHKLAFFENGATVNLAVVLDSEVSKEMFEWLEEKFRKGHEGVARAYKTLFMGGGADVKTVGADFRQMDFKSTQGAGETRIAAAAGVPPVIVGLSEGLQAATYSNYGQARRRFADGTMRPLWRNVAGSLSTLVDVPADARLWYDDRDIPFLQEDQKDQADIQQTHAATIRALVEAGFVPDDVVQAVLSGDLSRLEHTGLFSVQLQPANETPDFVQQSAQEAGRALAKLVEPHLSSNGRDEGAKV